MPVMSGESNVDPNKSSVSRCSLPGEPWFGEWPSYSSPKCGSTGPPRPGRGLVGFEGEPSRPSFLNHPVLIEGPIEGAAQVFSRRLWN